MKIKEVFEKNNINIPLTKEVLEIEAFDEEPKLLHINRKDNKYILNFEDNIELQFNLDDSKKYFVWYRSIENKYEKFTHAVGYDKKGELVWQT